MGCVDNSTQPFFIFIFLHNLWLNPIFSVPLLAKGKITTYEKKNIPIGNPIGVVVWHNDGADGAEERVSWRMDTVRERTVHRHGHGGVATHIDSPTGQPAKGGYQCNHLSSAPRG